MNSNQTNFSNRHASSSSIRQSNFELLRIISMILIIAAHFSYHGGFNFTSLSINFFWIQFLNMGGKVSVNIFILISGYFLINATKIKIKKILRLWLQIFTYSIIIYLVFVATGLEDFGIKDLIKSLLPISFEKWWFASVYFVLYLISPYINIFLKSLDKKTYFRMLVLLSFIWCVIPTFLTIDFESNSLIWFIYLYSLAGYIRLHSKETNIKCTTYLFIALIIAILTFLSVVIFDLLGLKFSIFQEHATYFYNMQRIPAVLISLFSFLGFKKIDMKSRKWINFISSATFGVYLIHDNAYIRSLLWNDIFKNASFSGSIMLVPYSIIVIIIVYFTCTIIELCRIYLVENNYICFINKLSIWINNKIESILSLKFFNKIN